MVRGSNLKQQRGQRIEAGTTTTLALGQVFVDDLAVEVVDGSPGYGVHFKAAGAFAAGQLADFVPGEGTVFGAVADEDAAVFQAVQLGAAGNADADQVALVKLNLLPLADDWRAAEGDGSSQRTFGLFFPDAFGHPAGLV